jgi:CHAT domain-containing protein
MTHPARLVLAALVTTSLLTAAAPAAQVAGGTRTTPRRRAVSAPARAQRSTRPPQRQPPPTQTGGGDDVGHTGTNPETGGEQTHPPRPPRGGDDRPTTPPRRRPPFGVVITLGGDDRPRDPRVPKDDKKDDKKDKAQKEDEKGANDPATAEAPRPLKYDGRAYRRLADSLLAGGRTSAALRVLELLKAQEYYQYTGSLGDTASAELPAPPDYRDLVLRVSSKKKGKDKGKKSDAGAETSDADADAGSWELRLERRADAVLALEQEAAALRAVPEATRTAAERQRLATAEAGLARASDDLDVLLEGLTRDLDGKDPRVKALRAADRLAAELVMLPGTAAIYTLTSEERFWAVVVSPRGSRAYATPIRATDLEREVLAFRKVLCNPKQDPAPLARALYDVVFARASQDPAVASARTLLWSFDGVLRYVPAAALNDGQQYLVSRYRNAVFNRASVDTLADAPSGRLSGVGLGVARRIAPYTPLPAVAEELGGIFASGGGTGLVPGEVLLDASFTEPALERALGGDNPVVHIATHFQLSTTDADDSVLLLGDGSLVNVGEIRKIKGGFRGVDLLTLSACDTAASGPSADGREVECFGTIAQERGAKSVIASLWPVSDRSTSLLMQTFYRMRAARPTASKAEVLRDAQQALVSGAVTLPATGGASRILVQEEPDPVPGQPAYTPDPAAPFAHPYYWAPFVMIGGVR